MNSNDPLESVYSFVERAYVRLQAGDVIVRCLEEEHTNPIQKWVEGLVLAGPENLGTLREILSEVGVRKMQMVEDQRQVLLDFKSNLKDYGINLIDKQQVMALPHLNPQLFLSFIDEQGIIEEETKLSCLQLFQNAVELIASLTKQLQLLEEIEVYLRDWLWGLVYQFAHQEQSKTFDSPPSQI